jgi:hypothetical protein
MNGPLWSGPQASRCGPLVFFALMGVSSGV